MIYFVQLTYGRHPSSFPVFPQVSPGRSIDGKGGDVSLPPSNINAKTVQKKSVTGSEKKCKKVSMPGGRRGLSSFSCINPELDSKSLILSQPVLTDTEQHAIFLHTCSACPPSQPCYPPELFDYLFIVIATVGRDSHTWRLRTLSAIARMNEHRWRGLAGRCSHTIFFLHLLNLKLSCPLAFFRECTCWKKRKICLASILVRFLYDGWCQQTQSFQLQNDGEL